MEIKIKKNTKLDEEVEVDTEKEKVVKSSGIVSKNGESKIEVIKK